MGFNVNQMKRVRKENADKKAKAMAVKGKPQTVGQKDRVLASVKLMP